MKIRLRKAHDFVLKAITVAAAALLILSAGCADRQTSLTFAVAVASLAWLSLFCYVNVWRPAYEKSLR